MFIIASTKLGHHAVVTDALYVINFMGKSINVPLALKAMYRTYESLTVFGSIYKKKKKKKKLSNSERYNKVNTVFNDMAKDWYASGRPEREWLKKITCT